MVGKGCRLGGYYSTGEKIVTGEEEWLGRERSGGKNGLGERLVRKAEQRFGGENGWARERFGERKRSVYRFAISSGEHGREVRERVKGERTVGREGS